jgi:hypothetical protein
MTEETIVPTEQTTNPTDSVVKPNNIEALENKNRELLGKMKAEREKRDELEKRLDAIEQEKLESQGKYQDINKSLKERLAAIEKEKQDAVNKFRFNAIDSSLKQAALEAGCERPDAVLKLLEDQEKAEIQVDENYRVDKTTVNPILERMKAEYPMLFKKTSIPVKDFPPTGIMPTEKKTEEDILSDYIKGLK